MPTRQMIRAHTVGLGFGSLGTTLFYVALHEHKWGAVAFILLLVGGFTAVTIRTYKRSPEK